MKRLYFLLVLCYSILSYSQELLYMGWPHSSINFEDTTEYKYISIDTSNIWQIIEPDKQILFIPPEYPHLGEYAIISDTNSYYTSNINASFQFKLLGGSGNYYEISFFQKFDFENNKDGGIIETSYDNGITWQNIILDSIIQNNLVDTYNLYSTEDTIISFENQPGFTGLQSDIERVIITFNALESMRGDSMLLKFSIGTDSADAQNEGWMLDDFAFGGIYVYVRESINNNGSRIIISPNPVKDVLEIKSDKKNITSIKIVSLLGTTLLEKNGFNLDSIELEGIYSGIYLIVCEDIKDNRWIYKIQKI